LTFLLASHEAVHAGRFSPCRCGLPLLF